MKMDSNTKEKSLYKKLSDEVGKISDQFYDNVATMLIVTFFLMLLHEVFKYAFMYFDVSFDKIDGKFAEECFFDINNIYYSWARIVELFAVVVLLTKGIKKGYIGVKVYLRTHIYDVLFGLVGVCMVISYSFSSYKRVAWEGNPGLGGGIRDYILVACLYMCAKVIKNKRNIRFILWSILLITIGQGYHICMQRMNHYSDLMGTFYNSNHVGYFIGMGIMANIALIICYRKKYWMTLILYVILGFNVMTLVLNNTFGVYLAVIVGFIFYLIICIHSKKKWIYEIIVGCMIFVSVSTVVDIYTSNVQKNFEQLIGDVQTIENNGETFEQTGSGRMELWLDSIGLVKKYPITGCGVGTIHKQCKGVPHNEFLQLAAESGIPAVSLYIVGLIIIVIQKWKKKAGLQQEEILVGGVVAMYIISSLFGVITKFTFPVYWMFLGLLGGTDE